MTQQVEIIGSSQEAVATLGGSAGHGKKAKKGLFTQLLDLIKQNPADKGSTSKDATVPAKGEHQGSVSLAKKPVLIPLQATSIDGEQKAKKQEKPELQSKVSIAEVNTTLLDTRALSGKPGNAKQGHTIKQTFVAVANQNSEQTAQGQQKQTGLHTFWNPDMASATQTSAGKKVSITEPKLQTAATEPKLQTAATEPKLQTATTEPKLQTATTEPKIQTATNEPKLQTAATESKLQATVNEPSPTHKLTKPQQAWPAGKIETADAQSVANRQLPFSNVKIETGEAQQSISERHTSTTKTSSKEPALQGLISSADVASAAKANVKELHATNPSKNAGESAPQEIRGDKLQAVKHEFTGKQATVSRHMDGDNYAGRVASASQEIIASRTAPDWKSVASQHRAAPVNGKVGMGNLSDTKNKNAHVDGKSADLKSAQKASAQNLSAQQINKQQHASLPAASPLNSSTESLEHMVDRSSLAARYVQPTSESHTPQMLTSGPVQIAQTQPGMMVQAQMLTSSGPWSVAAAMQEIGHAASQERYRLELNLDPAHLGKIKVYLDSDANKQIQVHLVVDQNASRQIIEQHLPALRQALAQHGLDMGGFSMDSHHGQDGQASASQHEQSDYAAATSNIPLETPAPQKSSTNARLSIRV